MAPDPPRVGDERLPTINTDLLPTIVNSDESDSNNDEIDSAIDEYMQAQGYTLFVGDVNDTTYHNNSTTFDDDDSDMEDNNGIIIIDQHQQNENDVDTSPGNLPSSSDLQSSVRELSQEEKNAEGRESIVEVCTSDNDNSEISRSDIKIDCDQVKAAMIGFSLPPSAIPPWAVGISDQDIASHVNRLLSNNSKK